MHALNDLSFFEYLILHARHIVCNKHCTFKCVNSDIYMYFTIFISITLLRKVNTNIPKWQEQNIIVIIQKDRQTFGLLLCNNSFTARLDGNLTTIRYRCPTYSITINMLNYMQFLLQKNHSN